MTPLHKVQPKDGDQDRPLFFVTISREARWDILNPGGGVTRTAEARWEILLLPGNLVGYGHSEKEAQEHLDVSIDHAIQKSGVSPGEWWNRRLNALNSGKRQLLEETWVEILENQRSELRKGKLFGRLTSSEAPRELLEYAGGGC